jgi:hypothetical protein
MGGIDFTEILTGEGFKNLILAHSEVSMFVDPDKLPKSICRLSEVPSVSPRLASFPQSQEIKTNATIVGAKLSPGVFMRAWVEIRSSRSNSSFVNVDYVDFQRQVVR